MYVVFLLSLLMLRFVSLLGQLAVQSVVYTTSVQH